MDISSNIAPGSPAARHSPRPAASPEGAGSRIPTAESGAAQAVNAAVSQAVQASAQSGGADLQDRRERSSEDLAEAVKNANEFFQMAKRTLQFSRYEDSDEIVFQIMDVETGSVVRQIPSEEMLALAKRLDELHGLLFMEKA